jgi:hypothetical protein
MMCGICSVGWSEHEKECGCGKKCKKIVPLGKGDAGCPLFIKAAPYFSSHSSTRFWFYEQECNCDTTVLNLIVKINWVAWYADGTLPRTPSKYVRYIHDRTPTTTDYSISFKAYTALYDNSTMHHAHNTH